jgi:hypothetical protein
VGIKDRLRKLESDFGRRECEECGYGREWSEGDYEVVWEDLEGPEDKQPEFCEARGRQLVFIVTWGDIPEDRAAE